MLSYDGINSTCWGTSFFDLGICWCLGCSAEKAISLMTERSLITPNQQFDYTGGSIRIYSVGRRTVARQGADVTRWPLQEADEIK